MKVIVVSGTPGTGKTTYSKRLAKDKKYKYMDVNLVVDKFRLSEGLDKKRDTKLIDTEKLNKVLTDIIKEEREKRTKGIVIDSHLSHYLPKEYVNLCVITKCDLRILKNRLEKRGYSKGKVRENLDAEIFDTCRTEALEQGHKVKVVDTSRKIQP